MADTRANLLTRKADLLAALRLIEQDYRDGVVDEEAYRAARHRYEQEAATVLERLDTMPSQHDSSAATTDWPPAQTNGLPRWLFVAGAGALVLAAIVTFLVLAVRPRGGTQSGTAQGSATPPTSPRLLAAEREVRAHPRSADALVNLGNVYWSNGQTVSADRAYQAAMRLAPNAPQPPTLHALIMGYTGQIGPALSLLHRVERAYPGYSRAWLLDGVLSERRNPTYAIAVWQRFLALEPNNGISATVRGWIARTKKTLTVKK